MHVIAVSISLRTKQTLPCKQFIVTGILFGFKDKNEQLIDQEEDYSASEMCLGQVWTTFLKGRSAFAEVFIHGRVGH